MIDNERQFSVESTVQRYSGAGGWHYVIVPKKQAMEIKKLSTSKAKLGSYMCYCDSRTKCMENFNISRQAIRRLFATT